MGKFATAAASWLRLFTPEEVVECVQQQLQVSMGISLPLQDLGEDEAERHLKYLPAYEREIVRRLSQGAPIYWACGRTPSTINRLIEGPLGTVACVIKPPGSALEFEIKRTGVGGAFPLTAIFTGFDGNPVPPSHRLRGGASTASLREVVRWGSPAYRATLGQCSRWVSFELRGRRFAVGIPDRKHFQAV